MCNQYEQKLYERIDSKTATVGVIGLGYVGLPLGLEAAKNGYLTIGFDRDTEKIQQLNDGESYITDLKSKFIQEALDSKRFVATSNFERLNEADIILICVPTPINEDQSPDLSYVQEAMQQISHYMKSGILIILESTTYPGTTREIVHSTLWEKGVITGNDCFIAYSPERIDPGNQMYNFQNTPKVVGGVTDNCTNVAKSFYESVFHSNVHTVSSPEIAEMEKLLENTFRQVNIALINELSMLCHKMDINIWEVIDAAATKPYGFMRFSPGPGVGGHCIPVDPQYLLWTGEQHGMPLSIVDVAADINEEMPIFVVQRLKGYLEGQGKSLANAKIAMIGVAYKPNINDVRESPALDVIRQLQANGCTVEIVDPYVDGALGLASVQLTSLLIQKVDGVVILTNHKKIDYELIDRNAAFIFDTRNVDYPFKNPNYYVL